MLNSVFESSPVQRKVINLINLLCKCVNKLNLNIVLKSAEKSAMLSSHGSGFRTLLWNVFYILEKTLSQKLGWHNWQSKLTDVTWNKPGIRRVRLGFGKRVCLWSRFGCVQPGYSSLVRTRWVKRVRLMRVLKVKTKFITNIPIQVYSANRRLAPTKIYPSNFIAISVKSSYWHFESNRSVRKWTHSLKW